MVTVAWSILFGLTWTAFLLFFSATAVGLQECRVHGRDGVAVARHVRQDLAVSATLVLFTGGLAAVFGTLSGEIG